MTDYPRQLDNGNGEKLTFVAREIVDGVERVIVEGEVESGKGPPMHTHLKQTESLTCVEGLLGYEIPGEGPRILRPGETVTFPPGTPHRFWAEGPERLKCRGYVSPPDNVEYFLGKVYESMSDNGDLGRPKDYDAAFLLGRYREEYAMPEIPSFVQKAIFPLLRGVGRLTGKARRFEDAPPPIAR